MKKILFFIACCIVHLCLYAQSWSLTGNAATSSRTNFIGTKDNQALVFRTNNTERIRILSNGNIGIGVTNPLQNLHVKGNINIDSGFALYIANHRVLNIDSLYGNTFLGNGVAVINVGKYNTGSGFQAIHSNTTGAHNTANGYKTLYSNTLGYYNMAVGSFALYHNSTGNQNIADGYEALYTNTTGNSNIAIGHFALGSNSTASFNTAIGEHALFHNTTGFSNTANGAWALYYNITGGSNVATGASALYSNTTGNYNTANGASSLYYNTTGTDNTATGSDALLFNTTGFYNTANGSQALFSNTTGNFNNANGSQALYYNTTGSNNNAYGYKALYANTTGSDNTANGYLSLLSNVSGNENTATGNYSLTSNTVGNFNTANGILALYSNTSGILNTASGYQALYYNLSGYHNTAYGAYALETSTGGGNTGIGYAALLKNTTGEENTAIGDGALNNNIDGWYNIAIGYQAGENNLGRNGWNNTFLGSGTKAQNDGTYNSTAIGSAVTVYASNQVKIGNDFVTSIGGPVNWTTISDGRVKKNMKENVPGLAFINKLKPLTYNIDLDAIEKFTQRHAIKDKDGKLLTQKTSPADINARNAKQQIVYTGFIAQDVEKAAKELKYDFNGVDAAKNDKDLYGLRYAEFVVPLVKAVQELSKDNDDLKSTLSDMVAQLAALKKQIDELKLTNTSSGTQHPTLDLGRLEQNAPNPFNNTTIISYYIPSAASHASLTIDNVTGQILKTISLNSKGAGEITISGGELSAGNYFYNLFIDGRKVDTKQMVLTK